MGLRPACCCAGALERERRAKEALETELRVEEARKKSSEGWGEAWELDVEAPHHQRGLHVSNTPSHLESGA
jgi:hypothetical protein